MNRVLSFLISFVASAFIGLIAVILGFFVYTVIGASAGHISRPLDGVLFFAALALASGGGGCALAAIFLPEKPAPWKEKSRADAGVFIAILLGWGIATFVVHSILAALVSMGETYHYTIWDFLSIVGSAFLATLGAFIYYRFRA